MKNEKIENLLSWLNKHEERVNNGNDNFANIDFGYHDDDKDDMNFYVDTDGNNTWKNIFLDRYMTRTKQLGHWVNTDMFVTKIRDERIDKGIGQDVSAEELQQSIDKEDYDTLYILLCKLFQHKMKVFDVEELVSSEMPMEEFISNHKKNNKAMYVSIIISYINYDELKEKYCSNMNHNEFMHDATLFESFPEVKKIRKYENNIYEFDKLKQHFERSNAIKRGWAKRKAKMEA